MASKMTKNRKKTTPARRNRRRRQERMMLLTVLAFLALCVGAFASLRLLNERGGTDVPSWKAADGRVQILAPAGRTLEVSPTEAPVPTEDYATATPEPVWTPEDTPEPAQPEEAPEIAAVPAATAGPSATWAPTQIVLTAVGDCTLGGDYNSGYYKSFRGYVNRNGYDYFLEKVRPLFQQDDLTIVNLEGPLTTSKEKRSGRRYNFKGDPEYIQILSGSSVEIANVANNHALDFGEEGFEETCRVVKAAGIGCSGFSEVYNTVVKGVRVCSIGFTRWAYDQEQVVKAVTMARPNCDLLLVSMHWGDEGHHEPSQEQISMGHAIIDAGADIVIGTHSHVYGAIEQYKDKYVIYSLGNFCFGGNRNPVEKDTIIFQQIFNIDSNGNVTEGGIDVIPARVSGSDKRNDYQPYIMEDEARAAKLLNKVMNISNLGENPQWKSGATAPRLLSR